MGFQWRHSAGTEVGNGRGDSATAGAAVRVKKNLKNLAPFSSIPLACGRNGGRLIAGCSGKRKRENKWWEHCAPSFGPGVVGLVGLVGLVRTGV